MLPGRKHVGERPLEERHELGGHEHVQGLAPVVVDYGGPPELIPEGAGECLALNDRKGLVVAFREALERCASDPRALNRMRQRAQDFVVGSLTWRRKAEQMREIYDWVIGRRDVPTPYRVRSAP